MLFPGHGAELPGMGLSLAAVDRRAAELLEHAAAVARIDDVTRLLQRGGDRLSDTRVLQPLLTAVALGLVEALARAGVRADVALGHSLGELAALSALQGASAELTIELAAVRGAALARLARERDGAMLALPAMDASSLEQALACGRSHGSCDVAVHASADGWVLAGERSALSHVTLRFGGTFLPTTGAWHSRAMTPARASYQAALEAAADRLRPPANLILDADGQLLGQRSTAELIGALVDQIDGPVRFAEGMATLRELEPRELVCVGPSRTLRALARANLGEEALAAGRPRLHVVENPADIDRLVELLEVSR